MKRITMLLLLCLLSFVSLNELAFTNVNAYVTSEEGITELANKLSFNDFEIDDDTYIMLSIGVNSEYTEFLSLIRDLSVLTQNAEIKKYLSTLNNDLFKVLNKSDFDVTYSRYSSFIFVQNTKRNDKKFTELFVELSYMDSVDAVWMQSEYSILPLNPPDDDCLIGPDGELVCPPTPPPPPPSGDDRIDDYDNFRNDQTYRGVGVKIGILDNGVFNPNHSIFSNIDAYNLYDTTVNDPNPDHPMKVASVLGGKYGIADRAKIYFADFGSDMVALTEIELLLDENVDVINMSFTTHDCDFGSIAPLAETAYLNFLSVSESVVFVAGTGNSNQISNSDSEVCHPAQVANIISVGSIDENGRPSDFSSYKHNGHAISTMSNPIISAVGENRYIGGYGYNNGTSFAAPAVTGTIALLIGKHGTLSAFNAMSILSVTANNEIISTSDIDVNMYKWVDTPPKDGVYEFWNDGIKTFENEYNASNGTNPRTGAGALDITAALDYEGDITSTNLPHLDASDKLLIGTEYLMIGQEIIISFAWEQLTAFNTQSGIRTYTSMDLLLIDTRGITVARTNLVDSNCENIRFDVIRSDTYFIKILVNERTYDLLIVPNNIEEGITEQRDDIEDYSVSYIVKN